MMTVKERHRMQRMEIENAELRAKFDKYFVVYRECSIEIIELRAKLQLIELALRGDA